VDREKQPEPLRNSPAPEAPGGASQNSDADEFFKRLKSDLHRPKPGQDAIAAALQAVQRLAHEVDSEAGTSDTSKSGSTAPARTCLICGSPNNQRNSFCGKCGAPLLDSIPDEGEMPRSNPQSKASASPQNQPAGEHHYHHHYHHHYFPAGSETGGPAATAWQRPSSSGSGREVMAGPAVVSGASLSRTEAAVRKLTREWAQACNTKQLDDLLDFYAPDALVLRSNYPPVRGAAAIREFFVAALDAGLGEVEMEALRVELFGDMAYEAGRCKMLVPMAVGKRREERGKYLVVFHRQPGGEWKAVADCWSSDLSLQVNAEPENAKANNVLSAASPMARSPRKTA
jgi:uncharacterized protein (TIGR02246 family)